MCVWVCLKIMDFPKTVLEMASFVSNQLDLRVSNFWMPMYGYFFSYLLLKKLDDYCISFSAMCFFFAVRGPKLKSKTLVTGWI